MHFGITNAHILFSVYFPDLARFSGKEVGKDGAGKANWGKDTDVKEVLDAEKQEIEPLDGAAEAGEAGEATNVAPEPPGMICFIAIILYFIIEIQFLI